ncbi:MAG: helix-turn-helix domain-containing protein [Acidobacteriaceae bacterium]
MPDSIPAGTLAKFTTFGDLLRFLRRRAGITQVELSIAVGYSDPQISRLEQNLRLPDIPTLEARFVKPLCLEDEPLALARLLDLAAEVRREDAPTLGLCPYKGLDYFDEADSDLFVGREALTERLVAHILTLASHDSGNMGRFFAIVGGSGCGKSSLVRAGLIPALRWNKASTTWLIQILTPTTHPLESLATTLTRANGSLAATAKLMDDLAAERRTLSLYIHREIKTSPGSYFLLVIDQFEELFALCRSEEERSTFIDNLLNAAYDGESRIIIVITLRADFYAHCSGYLRLREALAGHQEYIGVMSDDEMRRAVEEPARRGRWEFEPGLVDLILHDVGTEPGALPLLSHALLETWQRRHGRTMTFSGYASAGGVRGAIAETAETVYTDQFTSQQQAIARRIFLRLTELGDEAGSTGDTRRRATIKELITKPEEAATIQAVLKALADARLVTTAEDSVQVAHEALIREWPTLRGWLEENRQGLRLHRQLSEAAQQWQAAERGPDSLFRGARLAQAREWAEAHSEDMNAVEWEFLEASIAYSEREAAEREALRLRELEAAQKLAESERKRADAEQDRAEAQIKTTQRLRLRSILIAGSGILAIILAILALFAWRQAASQAAINLSLSLASAARQAYQVGERDLALALAMKAVEISPDPEAVKALREVTLGPGTRALLRGHTNSAQAVAISPDSLTAFSGGCAQVNEQGACQAGELILWDLVTMYEIRRWSAHRDWVNRVAYSNDGQYLVSSAQDGSLILWNLEAEKVQESLDLPGKITGFAGLPYKNSLLLSFADGSMLLLDFQSGDRQPFMLSSIPITALAIAALEPLAVTAHLDGSLTLWDLLTHQPIQSFPTQGINIEALAISPDGNRIFFADNGTSNWGIQAIDVQEGKRLNEQSLACLINDLAVSQDGAYLLAGCPVEIYLIDIHNWSIQDRLYGFPSLINGVAINRYGNLGISANEDGSLRVWNLGNQEAFQTLNLEADFITALATSPDGKYLLLSDASMDGNTRPALWEIEHRRVVKEYSLPIANIAPAAIKISPDGRYAAAGGIFSGIPRAVLWDLESGDLLCPPLEGFTVFEGYEVYVRAVAFSPDGRSLLAGTQTIYGPLGELFLWNVPGCKLIRKFETSEDITSIAFSSDGTRAITGTSFKGKVDLWDVATGKLAAQYTNLGAGGILNVAFGPGEQTILGSGTPDIYQWDVDTKYISQRYTGLTTYPFGMALSPDGRYVLSGTSNGDVVLWNFSTGEEVGRINTRQNVWSVAFTPDSTIAFAGTDQGKLIEWHFAEKPLSELIDWVYANRYVRELTPEERQQYHLSP